jgi:FAD/FMN-containing dehydrogenase
MPFPVLQSLFDPLLPSGMQWYWRADYVKTFDAAAIKAHHQEALKMPPGLSQVHLYPINGAAHRVGTNDTAFSYRDANFAVVIVGIDPDPGRKDVITNWCKAYFDATHQYSAGGAYINFMMEEGQERVQASFRENYGRLAQVKRQYDPANLFRVNQNIRPAEVGV